ncbi:ATP-binding protein [Aminobacter anthyllidis]|uniref:ATP-binding protein n=1 Tax=Aminobacter anthyllidis TaxID=1035067 RepID=UPI0024581CF2|nr:ATP-binding protein [Aminobacter anthyllidis]MDH4989183.1 ATP-binding protein [Aminobacter anthyllidis]
METPQLPALRSYHSWIANETLEDYSLRYAARSFRRWSPFVIANTALGGISFLALEAIGGAITLSYGFANAFPAILVTCLFIFLTSLPIAYYSSRYNIDMDLLTRGAGFGYVGSTITSLIYATFTFIFFALEGVIMAQALHLFADVPLVLGYVISSVVIIPITFMGVTLISKLQLLSQPIWIAMHLAPFAYILFAHPDTLNEWAAFVGSDIVGEGFNFLAFGSAIGVLCALSIQIGEQVDYLRFLPDKTRENRFRWWAAVIAAGPGWIIVGGFKILCGSLLAVLAIQAGLSRSTALEPIHMYIIAYDYVSADPRVVLALAAIFVLISQVKINVTNAYAGSLAWSNFFSRVTHYHPGRVVWLVFNILISLLLMLLGIFQTLELVLAVYSIIAAAWIGSIFADLAILKPLRVSPAFPEFKRAYLYNFNPVGCGSMALASFVALLCFSGISGVMVQAYAAPIAFVTALTSAVAIGVATKGRYYLARQPVELPATIPDANLCAICGVTYERSDMVHCTFYEQPICSLCCSLDSHCHDVCKAPVGVLETSRSRYFGRALPHIRDKIAPHMGQRLLKVVGVLFTLAVITGGVFLLTYRLIEPGSEQPHLASGPLLLRVFLALLPLLGIGAWWIVLSQESRELAERDLVASLEKLRQTQRDLASNERLAAIGQITATVSHELRNPLGTLVTSADVLRRSLKNADEPVLSELQRLQRNAWRCVRIIEDLLDFSRKHALVVTPILIDRWVAQHVAEQDATRPIQLELAAGCKVSADGERLRQAFSNVLANAIQACEGHTADNAAIVVSTRCEGDNAIICVADNGAGMSRETAARVFEPLFSTKAFGVGLGMPLVKRIVEQHGGSVLIDSEQGAGTRVSIVLPRAGAGSS